MLEAFIEFITNNNIPISLLDVSEESMRFMEAALKNHVNPQPFGETG
jgi:hypothetical protein